MPIQGYIEELSNRQARGWAFAPDCPGEHLLIEVFGDAGIIATTRANLFRADLKQAGVGDGDHAFVVNFPEFLDEAIVATVKVHAVSTEFGGRKLDFLTTSEKAAASATATPINAPDEADPLAEQQPLFILGAARSGTSAMAQSLLKSGCYEGYEEGHLFDLAARLITAVHTHYDANGEERLRSTLIAQVPLRFFNEAIKDQFRAIARFCFRGVRWLDKTPRREMILCAPLLREIWPNAKFVFMKRRGIENISSRLRKFPEISFADHCRDWAEAMRAWRTVRDVLGNAAIEIEQLDVATDPAGVVHGLAAFLDLSAAESMRLTELLAAEQPERTADRFAGVLDLDAMDWPSDAKAAFGEICMGEMNAFGYSIGATYCEGQPAH